MNARAGGLLKIIGAAVFYALLFATVLKDHGATEHVGFIRMILIALPGAIALAGLIELVTGTEFQKTASAWDDLAGWQRGLLGVLIVVGAFALMMAGVALFA